MSETFYAIARSNRTERIFSQEEDKVMSPVVSKLENTPEAAEPEAAEPAAPLDTAAEKAEPSNPPRRYEVTYSSPKNKKKCAPPSPLVSEPHSFFLPLSFCLSLKSAA